MLHDVAGRYAERGESYVNAAQKLTGMKDNTPQDNATRNKGWDQTMKTIIEIIKQKNIENTETSNDTDSSVD